MVLMSLWLPLASEISIKSQHTKRESFLHFGWKRVGFVWLAKTLKTLSKTKHFRRGKMVKCYVNSDFKSPENVGNEKSLWLCMSYRREPFSHRFNWNQNVFFCFWDMRFNFMEIRQKNPLGQSCIKFDATTFHRSTVGLKESQCIILTEI